MTGSGKGRKKTRREKQEKRELPAAGYFAIYYENPDGTVKPHREVFKIPSKLLVNCDDEFDVARVVKEYHNGVKHVLELEMRFCKGGKDIDGDFWNAFRGSNRTSPVQIYCPAPVGPVPDSAKLPVADPRFQSFVKSASECYVEWERSKQVFLEVKGDPFADFRGAFLIFVRECYVDLKGILVEQVKANGPGQRFILLGTAGIGKTFFSIFWVCYLATQKKRIVWKISPRSCYLLDFSQEVATVQGPVDTLNHVLLQVVNDKDSWLIIDGGHPTRVEYSCSNLLACSAKKENYHEFEKMSLVKTWYLHVWTEEEIKGFCNAFQEIDNERKSTYSDMDVPGEHMALENFKELGGVPRYVLHAKKMAEGRRRKNRALDGFSLEVISGEFGYNFSDMFIHMFVYEKYTMVKFDFACSDVRQLIDQRLMSTEKLHVVNFLGKTIKSSAVGTMWGHIYELVAHFIMSRGGTFKRKRVSESGAPVPDTVVVPELKREVSDTAGVDDLER